MRDGNLSNSLDFGSRVDKKKEREREDIEIEMKYYLCTSRNYEFEKCLNFRNL